MRKISVLAAAFALTLVVSPTMAKPKWGEGQPPGQAKKEDGWTPPGQAKKQAISEQDSPPSGPGNSANVHWCKVRWWDDDNDDDLPDFASFSQCVTHFAHALHTAHDDEEDANEDRRERRKSWGDGSQNQHGELDITSWDIDREGTFTLRGEGAEGDTVFVSVGGVSGAVVGFGIDSNVDGDGSWEVHGEWACQESDNSEEARFRAYDWDERVSELATFPCRDED
jgi:hypothetical protein